MKIFCTLFAVTLLLLWASLAFGQHNGVPPFSAVDSHDLDSIDLGTLVPTLHIPINPKSAGPLPGSITLESPQSCAVYTISGGTKVWGCNGNASQIAGFFPIVHDMAGIIHLVYTSTGGTCQLFTITGLNRTDNLSFFSLPSTSLHYPSTCGATSATVTSNDDTGMTVTIDASSGAPLITGLSNSSGVTYSFNNTTSTATVTDPFSNTITQSSTNFTDSLGASTTIGSSPQKYTYTDTTGTSQSVTFSYGTAENFVPLEGGSCSTGTGSLGSVSPPSSIGYPDGTSVGITWQANGSGISGLVGSYTNRTGGTVSYTYGTFTGTCTGLWSFSSLTRTTPDGAWDYSSSLASGTLTTTVLDPGKNKTVYTFVNAGSYPNYAPFTSSVDRYQNTGTVASPTYTHISETLYCYNTSSNPCTNTPAYPITQRDVYEYTYNGATQVQMSHDEQTYDSYGNVLTDTNTDSINNQTITTTYVYGTWNSTSCVAITNTAVLDHPCTITTKNGTTQLALESITYNANGAITADANWVSSTDTLTTNYTRNSTGTPATVTLPNSQVITNTFGSCNSLLLTDSTTTVNSVAIDNKASWNCDAGVVTDTTDPNSNEDDYAYDSMNRLSTYTNRLENQTTYNYIVTSGVLTGTKTTDPLSVVSYQYVDSLGRPTNSQVCQTTGCSNLDTSSTAYAWNGVNFETTIYVPCVKTTLNSACTTVALTSDANPIAGPTKSTDANSGTLTYAVNSKDFSVTAGPAPSQENTKVLQTEVDGFGRVNSTCALTASGYNGRVSCNQTMGNSGTLSSSTFTYGAGSYEVDTVRGSQTHKNVVDAIGRTTSTTTPEAGTTTFTYDTVAGSYCADPSSNTSAGDLMAVADAIGNHTCFYYDALDRWTGTGHKTQNSTNYCKRFRYDSTANHLQSVPTGYPSSGANIIGRVMEAETDDCNTSPAITDEWFAYDKMGRMTDMWESTPNSGGYYHATVTYDADGNVLTVSGIPSTSTLTFTMDGEGRPYNAEFGTTWVIGSSSSTGVSYDAASRPLTVPVGTHSGDGDTFTYDNVGNMTEYTFASNSTTDDGKLTWNPIGSLNKLAITDGFNSGGTQTCTYGTSTVEGYDDVGRLLDANCGSLIQHDSWTYDQYDNATRTGNPGTSWNPGYSSTNNEQTGSTYDSNGNVTNDGVNSYTWNVWNQMASVRSGSTAAVCGTSGTCETYDAFGRYVESNVAGTTSQWMYGPTGRLAAMNGQTTNIVTLPLPGGPLLYSYSGGNLIQHYDWLGTERLRTNLSTRAEFGDNAMTPYGETYDTFGTPDGSFTGDIQGIFTGLYDTPNRELFVNSSRWLSPDPAHAGWNAYAYPTDPNTQTDRSGLDPTDDIWHPNLSECTATGGQGPCKNYAEYLDSRSAKLDQGGLPDSAQSPSSDKTGISTAGITGSDAAGKLLWNTLSAALPHALEAGAAMLFPAATQEKVAPGNAPPFLIMGNVPTGPIGIGPGDAAWQMREDLIQLRNQIMLLGTPNQQAYAHMLPAMGEAVINPATSAEAMNATRAWWQVSSDLDFHNAVIAQNSPALVDFFNALGPEYGISTTDNMSALYREHGMYMWKTSPKPPIQFWTRRFKLRF